MLRVLECIDPMPARDWVAGVIIVIVMIIYGMTRSATIQITLSR
jgi:hypothetical protein